MSENIRNKSYEIIKHSAVKPKMTTIVNVKKKKTIIVKYIQSMNYTVYNGRGRSILEIYISNIECYWFICISKLSSVWECCLTSKNIIWRVIFNTWLVEASH